MARNYAALPYEYLEEMEQLNDAEFGRLTRALLTYSMTGEPIALCGNERFYAKRVMSQEDRFKSNYEEATDKKKEAGRRGAAKRWDSKNGNATNNDGKNSTAILPIASDSKNGYTETDTKTETNTLPSNDGRSNAHTREKSVVITAYMDKINATPSERCITELLHYQSEMGSECCLRAIDIALDAKKASWNYIRAILQNKHEHGVKCLADWEKLEEQYKKGGTAGGQATSGNTAGNQTQDRKWNIQSADLD